MDWSDEEKARKVGVNVATFIIIVALSLAGAAAILNGALRILTW